MAGTRGNEHVDAELSIAGGERKSIVLRFRGTRTGALRSVGWVALGVGGAGLLAGVVTGAAAGAKKGDFNESVGCRDNQCPPSQADAVDTYNALRHASTAAFVTGGILAAAGAVFLFANLSPSDSRAAVVVTPGSVSVRARF